MRFQIRSVFNVATGYAPYKYSGYPRRSVSDKLVHRWFIIKDMELFDQDTLDKIGKALLKKKETIAIAESVTSGLLQFAFSNIKDASCFYQGGITTFNIGQKYKHLQVDPVHALSVNGVSQTVAEEMAKQVCILFKSDWGIAITGYASAVPSSGNKIFAYYAISYKSKVKSKGKLSLKKTDPAQVQRGYVNTIVKKFLTLI